MFTRRLSRVLPLQFVGNKEQIHSGMRKVTRQMREFPAKEMPGGPHPQLAHMMGMPHDAHMQPPPPGAPHFQPPMGMQPPPPMGMQPPMGMHMAPPRGMHMPPGSAPGGPRPHMPGFGMPPDHGPMAGPGHGMGGLPPRGPPPPGLPPGYVMGRGGPIRHTGGAYY